MLLQSSTFKTSHVMDNEIAKANDFEFAFEQVVQNVSKATQMMLESRQDFIINGKVLPYSGMNVVVSPIYGVCKSTGVPFGCTEESDPIAIKTSESGRIDIIEIKSEWRTYDYQQRAFNDPDADVQTYQYIDTKKLMAPVYTVKKGDEGTMAAPEVDDGYVKIAEIVVRANADEIEAEDIKNVTADIAGLANEGWTTEPAITYNIGYISDVNARFRVQHNADGTHKDDAINSDSLDIGTGAKQVNGNILPIGGAVNIPSQAAVSATDSIASVLIKTSAVLTTIYNAYLKYNNYNFKGDMSVSAIADENNVLKNPLTFSAAGDGTALIKLAGTTVLSIGSEGKLSTNGYEAVSPNNIVTKAVTDAIYTALSALESRVRDLENSIDDTEYVNGTLSAGTGGRYNVVSDSIYVATTENITLSGAQKIDNIDLADGVSVLVKNQINKTENGIYRYSSASAWSRTDEYISPALVKARIFPVANGETNKGKMFYLPKSRFNDDDNFGADAIEFSEYLGSVSELPRKTAVRDNNGCLKTAESKVANDCVSRKEVVNYNTAVAKAIFDYVWPIGSVYTQYPNTEGPETLFPGTTWVKLDYGGAFFRSEGGDYAKAFNGGLQLSQNKDHDHSGKTGNESQNHTHSGTTGGMKQNSSGNVYMPGLKAPYQNDVNYSESQYTNTAKGCFQWERQTNHDNQGGQLLVSGSGESPRLTINVWHDHDFTTGTQSASHTHSIQSDGGAEARPDNYTIRIWKRTA